MPISIITIIYGIYNNIQIGVPHLETICLQIVYFIFIYSYSIFIQ